MTQRNDRTDSGGHDRPLVATRRAKGRARGASLKDLVSELEQDHPDLAAQAGVSSAAVEAGDMIRAARQAAGLSQRELAAAAGLHQSAISSIERGEGKDGPTYRKMRAIADALGMRMAFMSGEDFRDHRSARDVAPEEALAVHPPNSMRGSRHSVVAMANGWTEATELAESVMPHRRVTGRFEPASKSQTKGAAPLRTRKSDRSA